LSEQTADVEQLRTEIHDLEDQLKAAKENERLLVEYPDLHFVNNSSVRIAGLTAAQVVLFSNNSYILCDFYSVVTQYTKETCNTSTPQFLIRPLHLHNCDVRPTTCCVLVLCSFAAQQKSDCNNAKMQLQQTAQQSWRHQI